MKRTGPTNPVLQQLIRELKLLSHKEKNNVWKRVAEELEKPTRMRCEVNISHINAVAQAKETIIVPGKVLGAGDLHQPCTVVAWQFSTQAREKIEGAKGTCFTLSECMKKNPKATQTRIIG